MIGTEGRGYKLRVNRHIYTAIDRPVGPRGSRPPGGRDTLPPTLPVLSSAHQLTACGSLRCQCCAHAAWFIGGIFVIMTIPISVYEVGRLPRSVPRHSCSETQDAVGISRVLLCAALVL
jgi:hypothetical protein